MGTQDCKRGDRSATTAARTWPERNTYSSSLLITLYLPFSFNE